MIYCSWFHLRFNFDSSDVNRTKFLRQRFKTKITRCRRAAATICLRPCKLTISSYLFARWHLFRHVGYLRHQQQVDLESRVRVTCDVGYICSKFSLSRPLCPRVTPDVRDRRQTDVRQTDVRQKHRLMLPPYGGGGITRPRPPEVNKGTWRI